MILTVIFRDDAPMIHCGGSPAYRSIRIELTAEQEAQISAAPPGPWGKSSSEEIDKCFIEPVASPRADKEGDRMELHGCSRCGGVMELSDGWVPSYWNPDNSGGDPMAWPHCQKCDASTQPSADVAVPSGLELASIGRRHFGNPIPQEWYAAARDLIDALRSQRAVEGGL